MNNRRAALLSVSDKSGLVEFAQSLEQAGFIILSTSGTAKTLVEAGIEVVSIETYTGQKEILDGRVKTLHPKIHAGLLAKRDDPKHMAQLAEDGIYPIDVAVINLYPFIQGLGGDRASDPSKMIELIDVGGPTMIRAAAKNFRSIYAVIDPADYKAVAESISTGEAGLSLRQKLAVKVFSQTANYDLEIARYFGSVEVKDDQLFRDSSVRYEQLLHCSEINGFVLRKEQNLRYGENPNQIAAFYRSLDASAKRWTQLGGKDLSYNNLLDFDAMSRIVRELPSNLSGAVIIKHLNPCGAALANDLLTALHGAKRGDPRSHFGGIIGFNQTVTMEVAEQIREDFAEVVVAPDFEPTALSLLSKNKNLRLIRIELAHEPRIEVRSIEGGLLVQSSDSGVSDLESAEIASDRSPTPQEFRDLEFAWLVCAHVKSNAIVLAKDSTIIGVGAGQMSRIDSVELSISKAKLHGHVLAGAVCASDAFFPFADSIETLASAGITAIVAPKGAKKDAEVVELANKLGMSLVFTTDRHFRH